MSDEIQIEPVADIEAPILEPVTSTEAPVEVNTEVSGPKGESGQLPVNEPIKVENPQKESESVPIQGTVIQVPESPKTTFSELLLKARNMVQIRKRKKLERIMSMFDKSKNISNDQVEKLLHISDSTATRYLSILEKEGKIRKSESKGSKTSYIKI
jgi:predicted HTH transcriptional regulator